MDKIELQNIKNVYNGKYIKMYEMEYLNLDGKSKTYEMASRYNILSENDILSNEASGVSLIIFNESYDKILLLKEFRMATNTTVVNFVSGLIDKNEFPLETAMRELKEETGLDITRVIGILPEAYSAIGITNEKTITIICTAKGNFSQSTSPNELIETNWYSKDDVKKIISECTCASNVCLFSYLWINNFLNLKSLT